MLRKKRISRKRNRQFANFFKKLSVFLIAFAISLVSLILIFNKRENSLLSPVSLATKNTPKEVLDSNDTTALKKALDLKKISYEEIKVSTEGAYMIKLTTGEDVFLSTKKDLSQQLSSLQVIYSRLTMEGRSLRKLDLRYDKPVVVFK